MRLETYQRKRRFDRTPEPRGGTVAESGARFVIQKHAARRLHYDFRLELDGVLKSWAVPKGPSLDPQERRLAVHVEDHPLEYGDFEGVIPPGEYGGGTVLVWDTGTWAPEGDPRAGYRKGHLRFQLHGQRLQGGFSLVRTGRSEGGKENWLLIKHEDAWANPARDPLADEASVLTGRHLPEIAHDASRVWDPQAGERSAPRRRADPFPGEIRVQLATLVERAPQGDHWVHEIKLDGYRTLTRLTEGIATLFSRNGLDWTGRFGALAAALRKLDARNAWLDGEVAVLHPDGRTSFGALQKALSEQRDGDLVYFLFDLLYLDGEDLRPLPLLERKRRLGALLDGLGGMPSPLRYCDHLQGRGLEFQRQACAAGLEGIVCKRGDRPHSPGRGRDWLKLKCLQRQEFVIAGYTDPEGARNGFGALLLGVREGDALRYAGRVGTGFSEALLASLHPRLLALEQRASPFDRPLPREARKGVHFVRPELVGEVAFADWTEDGVLRHPAFEGLREDKPAREVVEERPAPPRARAVDAVVAGLRLSNPDRVLWPEQGVTKRDLALYYESVAARLLPEVSCRPLTLFRCPEGRHRDCFFQKRANETLPREIRRIPIPEKGELLEYTAVDTLAGVVGLVQMGVLELHVWGARSDQIERPDRLVFDLDPDEGLPWERVLEGARTIQARLLDLKLTPFLRTTGGKGLHVVVPIARRHSWEEAKGFAEAVARDIVRTAPHRYTASLAKRARSGKVFIDYLRNARGATAVCSYTPRARPGAPVATPVAWDSLTPALNPAALNLRSLPGLLGPDPWEGIGEVRPVITARMWRELGVRR